MTFKPSTPINLASAPFGRERAQNALLLGLCAALLASLLIATGLIFRQQTQAKSIKATIEKETAQLRLLDRQQANLQAVLKKPENAEIFAKSAFLNSIIARRAVSWTKVFEDLEKVMPYNVRLVTVRLPQVSAEETSGGNRILLDMTVGAERPESILDFLKKLEKSDQFGPASVANSQPPTQTDSHYRYRINVTYTQKF